MARPPVEPRLLEAALSLFADHGYSGVTTRELARKAKTTEASIYRLYQSKERVFEITLNGVVDRALDPAQLLMMIFENKKKQPLPTLLAAAVQKWYASLPAQAARLLLYAYLSKNEAWRAKAQASIEKIIEILATSMETEAKKPGARKFNPRVAAHTLILALFQYKIGFAAAHTAKEEAETVQEIVRHCLQGLTPPS